MDNETIRKVVYEYRELTILYPEPGPLNELARDGWDVVHIDTKTPRWIFLLRRECAVINMSIVPKEINAGAD